VTLPAWPPRHSTCVCWCNLVVVKSTGPLPSRDTHGSDMPTRLGADKHPSEQLMCQHALTLTWGAGASLADTCGAAVTVLVDQWSTLAGRAVATTSALAIAVRCGAGWGARLCVQRHMCRGEEGRRAHCLLHRHEHPRYPRYPRYHVCILVTVCCCPHERTSPANFIAPSCQ
jgi:hypothetical protein